jgi:hypothetical protein
MDELKWLQSAAGQTPAPPEVDVADDVMRTLSQQRSAASTPMLLAVALASWALAGVAVLIAQQAVAAWQDPLSDLLRL